MKKILLAMLVLGGCGELVDLQDTVMDSLPSDATQGLSVHYISAKGVYGVDLTIDGTLVKDIMLDTGSSNLIIVGSELTPDSSPLSSGASFNVQYGIGGGVVQLFNTVVSLNDTSITYNTGVYKSGSAILNVLGLGFAENLKSLPGDNTQPFLDSYAAEKGLNSLFTLNLCEPNKAGSFMLVGSESKGVAEFNYTPIVANRWNNNKLDHFAVQPKGFYVGEELVAEFPTQADGYFTLIDSGTNGLFYLPASILSSIAIQNPNIPAAFWDYSNPNHGTITQEQKDGLRPLFIEFPSTDGGFFKVEIPVNGYIKGGGNTYYSITTKAFPLSPSVKGVLLGTAFMQNVVTVFDKDNLQIGMTSNKELCK